MVFKCKINIIKIYRSIIGLVLMEFNFSYAIFRMSPSRHMPSLRLLVVKLYQLCVCRPSLNMYRVYGSYIIM